MEKYFLTANKTKVYFNNKNQYHRINGPAIEYFNGDKCWYFNGKRHRIDDGPARDLVNGEAYYYINDKILSKQEFDEIKNFPMLW